MSEQWYWCLLHQKVETAGECRADDRMGPYESPEAARRWRERHEDRSIDWLVEEERHKDEWDREDERWERWGER